MIREWYQTEGMKIAEMLKVSDDFTLSISNGEVTRAYSEDNITETLNDPDIFGDVSSANDNFNQQMKSGHIRLAAPVVNIQYYKGRKPVLSGLLKLSMDDLENIIYHGNFIITDSGNTDLYYKQILSYDEYLEKSLKYNHGFKAFTGAEAIEILLNKENVRNRKYMIFHTIPVLPIKMRYLCSEIKKDLIIMRNYQPSSVNYLYERLLVNNERAFRLMKENVPEIMMINEKRMLQEKVDSLISNGIRNMPVADIHGMPLESLEELYIHITKLHCKKYKFPVSCTDTNSFITSVNNYWKYYEDNGLLEKELLADDSLLLELDKLRQSIRKTLKPFLQKYIQLNYKEYLPFTDDIFAFATEEFVFRTQKVYERLHDEKNPLTTDDIKAMVSSFEKAIAGMADVYIKKQLRWKL